MRIIRFGPDLGQRIDRFGSDFRHAHVAEGAMHVAAVHLEPGGSIGRHPAVARQLLCVVSGSGWVAGGDGVRQPISAGEGAWWEPGEEHETGTEAGLTALVLEGDLDVTGVVTRGKPVVVVDPDPEWPSWFEQIRALVAPALGDLPLAIEHVGSTSVPGLAAKPIIDLDVVVSSPDEVPEAIRRLATVGYRHRGDLGLAGREAFRPPADVELPRHHLYVVVDGSKPHLDHVLLRDHLRAHPDDARRYGDLKRRNAAEVDDDIDLYLDRKHDLVEELLRVARASRPR